MRNTFSVRGGALLVISVLAVSMVTSITAFAKPPAAVVVSAQTPYRQTGAGNGYEIVVSGVESIESAGNEPTTGIIRFAAGASGAYLAINMQPLKGYNPSFACKVLPFSADAEIAISVSVPGQTTIVRNLTIGTPQTVEIKGEGPSNGKGPATFYVRQVRGGSFGITQCRVTFLPK